MLSVLFCFGFSIYAQNAIFKKRKKANKNTNEFKKIAGKNTNKSLHLNQHMLSMSDMPFAWGSSYVKKTYEVR